LDFGTVLTVLYFVVFHGCWNCPDSVVFCCFSIGYNKIPHCQNISNIHEKQQNTTVRTVLTEK
jgi:hypothetical protein